MYIVYTAIIGDYDRLPEVKFPDPEFDYICFTDNDKIKSDIWRIVKVDRDVFDNTKQARKIKISPHFYLPEHEFSIWIDANVSVIKRLDKIKEKFFRDDFKIATFSHPLRNCIYEEALAVIEGKKDSVKPVYEILSNLISNEYPLQNGLAETNVLIRRNTSEVNNAMDCWWNYVFKFSKRDQLSFDFVMNKIGIQYEKIPGNARENYDVFKCSVHKYEENYKFFLKKILPLKVIKFIQNCKG